MGLRVLHLYRPTLPSTRAQSIQVLGSCHGLAKRGCEVLLLADPPPTGPIPEPEEALAFYGLEPVDGLDLRIAPAHGGSARSLWFRKHALGWVALSMWKHPQRSVILGRAKRYIDEYLTLPWGPPVVLEAHEVDSRAAPPAEAAAAARLERRLLLQVQGLVTNCEGTLRLLEETHPGTLPRNTRVVHNATASNRVRNLRPQAQKVVGYAGSLRALKAVPTLIDAARRLPEGWVLEVLGGTESERAALHPLPPRIRLLGELPHAAVPDLISRWHCAVVSLDDDLFGRHLSNPLKVWDYLAVGVPIVAPELPSLREVLDDRSTWYIPGDSASLADAIGRSPALGVRLLRSWEQRADELIEVLTEALG